MPWFINGSDAWLTLDNAMPAVHGRGSQSCRLATEASSKAMHRVMDIPAVWSIVRSDAPEAKLDPIGYGLVKRIAEKPNESHFQIAFFGKSDPTDEEVVGFTICLPPSLFESHFALWRDFLFGPAEVRYQIMLDYIGFKAAGAATDNITVDEWLESDVLNKKVVSGIGVHLHFSRAEKSQR